MLWQSTMAALLDMLHWLCTMGYVTAILCKIWKQQCVFERERESIGNFHLNCENKEKAPSALDRYKAEGWAHLILMHTHVGDVITTHYSHFFTDQRCDNVPRNAEMCQQRQRRGTMQANEHGCDKLQVFKKKKKQPFKCFVRQKSTFSTFVMTSRRWGRNAECKQKLSLQRGSMQNVWNCVLNELHPSYNVF